MPAKDIYHNAVKNALIKEGWTITADPYLIKYEDAGLYADLAAEKPIAAERQGQKIIVEIKSFVGRSLMYDFHAALGQYIVYRNLIQLTAPEYTLYLAIDDVVYKEFFQRKGVKPDFYNRSKTSKTNPSAHSRKLAYQYRSEIW